MQIFSKGDFYLGIDEDKFCDFDIHLGRFVIQYSCPNGQNALDQDSYPERRNPQIDGQNSRPAQGSDN